MRFAHCVTGHTCYVWCISKGDTQMTRYFANSAATRKNRPLTTGMETEAEARAQAKFLADTYGGVAMVSTNKGDLIAKYSAKRGWH
jgi:hypothetical protein